MSARIMQRITLHAGLDAYRGYGLHAIEIAKGLLKRGIYPAIRPLAVQDNVFGASIPADIKQLVVAGRQPEPWELLLSPPFVAPTPGKRTIYFTMWESTQLPKRSVDMLNLAEAVIVPCEWCKETFHASGVKPPIFVVPLGIDPSVFTFKPLAGPTIFGSAGRVAHGRRRKGLDSVVRAFRGAFPGESDVVLEVKVHKDCEVAIPPDPRIKLLRGHWPIDTVANWLHRLTCFVSASAGEGWGFWQHQAMACGRPVIAPIYGGLREFMDDDTAYPVDYIESEADGVWTGKWAHPDERSLAEQMRSVYRNRDQAKKIGHDAGIAAHSFTWERSIDELCNVLDEVGALECERNTYARYKLNHRLSYAPKKPATPGAFQFFHGLGDCCNAATLFRAAMNETGNPCVIQTHPEMEFIFRSAGCEIVDYAPNVHLWEHPRYDSPAHARVWADNKIAHNSPVPMTPEFWKKLCDMEIPLQVSDQAVLVVDKILSEVTPPFTVLHTRGNTSAHLKDFPMEIEKELCEKLEALPGTVIALSPLAGKNIRRVFNFTPEMLYELIRRSQLLIGIDSGPLHLARMTNTPVIGCWFKMNPSAFTIPSTRAVHLTVTKHSSKEYGSSDHYAAAMYRRKSVFNIEPMKEETAAAEIVARAMKVLK